MIIIASKYLIPKGYTAMAFYPFIFLREKQLKANRALMNHEQIHLRQQTELLVLPFYIWYTAEFLVRLAFTRNRHRAYRGISFEREAYAFENDNSYLSKRSFWNFTKFFFSFN